MRKQIFIVLVILSIMTFSCTEEDSIDFKNIDNTAWRCTDFGSFEGTENYEYLEIKFYSSTTFYIWLKEKNAPVRNLLGDDEDYKFYYSIKDNQISAYIDDPDEIQLLGTIDNKKMSLKFTDDKSASTLIFTKQ